MTNVSDLIGSALSPSQSEFEKTLKPIARCPVATIEENRPPEMVQEHRRRTLRQHLLGKHINNGPVRCDLIERLEIVSGRVGPKPLEDFLMSARARLVYGADQILTVLVVLVLIIASRSTPETETKRRGVWICACPQTQLNTLLVPFSGMMTKRDVQLRLHSRIGCAMAFGEAKERSVARVVREGGSQRVPFCEIDAEVLKSFEQLGLVRVEQRLEIHVLRIGAPREEKVREIERSSLECFVQDRTPVDRLERKVVAVAQEQNDEIPMLGTNRRAK